MGSVGVVVQPPDLQILPGILHRPEEMGVKTLVPETAIVALDQRIIDWLAILCPQHRTDALCYPEVRLVFSSYATHGDRNARIVGIS